MTLSSLITILQKIIDISLVWILIYSVLKSLKDNVKMILIFKGVIIIVIVKLLSDYLNLTTVGLLLEYVIMWGPLALIIIFQPEIRKALENLGQKNFLTSFFVFGKNPINVSGLLKPDKAKALTKAQAPGIIVYFMSF